jgi:hypothetical protein
MKELQDKVCINCSKFIELNPLIEIDTKMKIQYPLVQQTLIEHKKLQKLVKNIKCDKVDKLILQDIIQVNLIMETLTLRYSRGSN